MAADTLAFKVIVRRVATGTLPFQWQVERNDTLALIQVSAERFRGMQEAYEAGQTWLTGFLASRPIPKRPSISLRTLPPKDIDELTSKPLMDLEDEVDDLVALDHDDVSSVQLDW